MQREKENESGKEERRGGRTGPENPRQREETDRAGAEWMPTPTLPGTGVSPLVSGRLRVHILMMGTLPTTTGCWA